MHTADTECYGKGSESKPRFKAPECKELHAESLHNIIAGMMYAVNAVDFDENDKEEDYIITARGE